MQSTCLPESFHPLQTDFVTVRAIYFPTVELLRRFQPIFVTIAQYSRPKDRFRSSVSFLDVARPPSRDPPPGDPASLYAVPVGGLASLGRT
eukprot:6036024-Pyramimonas_sp.AAC.1